MKWSRFLCAAAVFALISCSSPSAPKYPDPEDEEEPNPTDPDKKRGFLLPAISDITFLV